MSSQAYSDSVSILQGGDHRHLVDCAKQLPVYDEISNITSPGSGDTESDYHHHRQTGRLLCLARIVIVKLFVYYFIRPAEPCSWARRFLLLSTSELKIYFILNLMSLRPIAQR
jgi:hypothetical protein